MAIESHFNPRALFDYQPEGGGGCSKGIFAEWYKNRKKLYEIEDCSATNFIQLCEYNSTQESYDIYLRAVFILS